MRTTHVTGQMAGGLLAAVVLASCWLTGCGGVVGGVGGKDAANPGVLSPSAVIYGKTYGEWSAVWWQWALSIPAADSPLPDPTGEKAGVGQSGPVWFLCGTTGTPPIAERTISIPVGRGVFFPIVNVVSTMPMDGTADDQLRAADKFVVDHVTDLVVVLDGRSLQGLFNYRFASPIFAYDAPPLDEALWGGGYEGHHDRAHADGYWIMLEPLSPGAHEIYFRGKLVFPGTYPSLNVFETAVTYHITVE
jgi:hypothetical protein